MNINNRKNIVDVSSNYFLTVADNSAIKNISNATNTNTINIHNDTFMHFMSQAFKTKYPYMSSKPTMTKELENINKVLNAQNSQGYD